MVPNVRVSEFYLTKKGSTMPQCARACDTNAQCSSFEFGHAEGVCALWTKTHGTSKKQRSTFCVKQGAAETWLTRGWPATLFVR